MDSAEAGRIKDATEVGLADLHAQSTGDLVGNQTRARRSGRNVDDDAPDVVAGHPLRRLDGGADRRLGGVQIDERAVSQPLRGMMADADDPGWFAAAGRAMRQHTFVVPMSSAATKPLRAFAWTAGLLRFTRCSYFWCASLCAPATGFAFDCSTAPA